MIKAWLIIFVFSYQPNDFSLEEDRFLGKIEIPYTTMKSCSDAKQNLTTESEDLRYQFICVTDDHHSGRKQDPNVPFD